MQARHINTNFHKQSGFISFREYIYIYIYIYTYLEASTEGCSQVAASNHLVHLCNQYSEEPYAIRSLLGWTLTRRYQPIFRLVPRFLQKIPADHSSQNYILIQDVRVGDPEVEEVPSRMPVSYDKTVQGGRNPDVRSGEQF